MKKVIFFVLTVVCLAAGFVLLKDPIMDYVKEFKYAFKEVDQWKTLM